MPSQKHCAARLPQFPDIEEVYSLAAGEPGIALSPVIPDFETFKKERLSEREQKWLEANGFSGNPGEHIRLPGEDGGIGSVVFVPGKEGPSGGASPGASRIGSLARSLPSGTFALDETGGLDQKQTMAAALAWGLGGYRFRSYKQTGETGQESTRPPARARLKMPRDVNGERVRAIVEGVWLGRNLINTPASDLGPAEIEAAVRELGERHGAAVTSIVGDALIEKNFPMIHAVGRASPREPRLIELNWSPGGADVDALKRVTLVGKGICFDTGGLDIKPAAGMLLMKKDMGGSATVLAIAHMIMACALPVRLRVLIPSAENAIAGNAFRPGDVLTSRAGKTVEVGNTDAEGRLVLADALALADEETPDYLFCCATLTGSARVALGPDLPALFCDDDAFAGHVASCGLEVADPVWRLPLWAGYDDNLKSPVADLNNISPGPLAGAITAALFLKRFVSNARVFAHFDLYGWRPKDSPIGPKGGEVQSARAIFECLSRELTQP